MSDWQLGWVAILGSMTGICVVLCYACLRLAKEADARRPGVNDRRPQCGASTPDDAHHQRVREIGQAIDAQILKLKKMNDELERFNKGLLPPGRR